MAHVVRASHWKPFPTSGNCQLMTFAVNKRTFAVESTAIDQAASGMLVGRSRAFTDFGGIPGRAGQILDN
jgi:hypothetical protein